MSESEIFSDVLVVASVSGPPTGERLCDHTYFLLNFHLQLGRHYGMWAILIFLIVAFSSRTLFKPFSLLYSLLDSRTVHFRTEPSGSDATGGVLKPVEYYGPGASRESTRF